MRTGHSVRKRPRFAGPFSIEISCLLGLFVAALPRQVFKIREFGNTEDPGAPCLRMFDGPIDLGIAQVSFNVQHLTRIDQVGIFDLVAVSLEQQRPLVGIAVDLVMR